MALLHAATPTGLTGTWAGQDAPVVLAEVRAVDGADEEG